MVDLIYFGDEYDEGSEQHETEFLKEIKHDFPDVKLENAYDPIKGYRQQVTLSDEQELDYQVWLIGFGWFTYSFALNLVLCDDRNEPLIDKLLVLARERYRDSFIK